MLTLIRKVRDWKNARITIALSRGDYICEHYIFPILLFMLCIQDLIYIFTN
jgi:hypothetical protein